MGNCSTSTKVDSSNKYSVLNSSCVLQNCVCEVFGASGDGSGGFSLLELS